ncbi:MAG TPA: DUF3313 family protein [Burkholderiales bacterium]|nr:DUF3313 family protein [Burkholderiales bacterium]
MNLPAFTLVAITVSALLGCATPADRVQTTKEGLSPIHSRNLDEVYVRPDATLSAYGKVFIEPVAVALRDDYVTQRHAYNRFQPIYPRYQEAETLLALTAQSVHQGLEDAFKARGYTVLEAPDAGALRIAARVTDLFVNAPDRLSPWITRNLTRNAGEAKLALEVRDAAQGTLLAQIAHHLIVREVRGINLANDVTNDLWLDSAFRRWAADSAAILAARRTVASSGS